MPNGPFDINNESKNDDYFKIIWLNCQSIVNKMNKMEMLIYNENPQIISVSESWCNNLNLKTIILPNYIMASSYVSHNHIHGGVLIFVENGIIFKNLEQNFSEEMHVELCAISFSMGKEKYCLITVYRPPSGCINIFINRLSQILEFCKKKFTNIMLCGDININFLLDSNEKKILCDLLQSYELQCQNNEPTRIFITNNGHRSVSKGDYFFG